MCFLCKFHFIIGSVSSPLLHCSFNYSVRNSATKYYTHYLSYNSRTKTYGLHTSAWNYKASESAANQHEHKFTISNFWDYSSDYRISWSIESICKADTNNYYMFPDKVEIYSKSKHLKPKKHLQNVMTYSK